jgi:hypothetical protein
MKRAILAASILASGALLAYAGLAAQPSSNAAARSVGDAPTVSSLRSLLEKEIHWGMSHQEVIDVYNNPGGFFDREYAPQMGKLQPGVAMQELEADRDNRKANFARGFSAFLDTPTGYDLTPIHAEYTYKNDEAIQPIFRSGKKRYFFYIKDRLWKVYDEIPLKADGPLGATFQDAVTKLNAALGQAGRVRAADPAHDLELTTADWQDASTHLRAMDRSHEHLVAVVLEDKSTLNNLAALRSHKATDPFAVDPSIQAITKNGVSDPNAAKTPSKLDGGVAKKH